MKRPVILIGNGARNNMGLVHHLTGLGVPILTTWMGMDLVAENCPTYCGRPGLHGQRAANIIQQKATEIYVFGARLDGEQVAYNLENFAPHAVKHIYDVDPAELDKLPASWDKHDKDTRNIGMGRIPANEDWLTWARQLYLRFRWEFDGPEAHPIYQWINNLILPNDEVIALSSSGTFVQAFLQSYKVRAGQMIRGCSTIGSMGFDAPWVLGAWFATHRHVTCLTGDGGFQLNFQALQTIQQYKIPCTFYIACNGGYASIRNSQLARFGRKTGADEESGLSIIPVERIVAMFPEVNIQPLNFDPNFSVSPRCATSMINGVLSTDPMEDMTPKIDDLDELMRWGDD